MSVVQSPSTPCEAIQASTGLTACKAAIAVDYLSRTGWHLVTDKDLCALRGERATRLEVDLR